MHNDPHIANMFSAEEEDCLSLEQMEAYQQGKLPADARHVVERHLLNCELCAISYEGMVEHGAEALATGAAEVSDRAWERAAQGQQKKRRGAFLWIASAAAIALLVTVGYVFLKGPSVEEMDNTVAEILENSEPIDGSDPRASSPYAMNHSDSESEGSMESANPKPGDFSPSRDMIRAQKEPMESPAPGDQNGGGMLDARTKTVSEGKVHSGESKMPMPNGELGMGGKSEVKGGAGPGSSAAKKEALSTPTSNDAYPQTIIAGSRNNANLPPQAPTTYSLSKNANEDLANDKAGAVYGEVAEEQDGADDMEGVVMMDVVTTESSMGRERREAKKDEPSKGKRDVQVSVAAPSAKGAIAKPTAPGGGYDKGLMDYEAGRYADAAQELRKVTEQSPENLDAHIRAADAFIRISQPKAALYHLERVLAVPGNSYYEDAQWYKALALLQLHEGRKAKSQLEEIVNRGGKYKAQAEAALKSLE